MWVGSWCWYNYKEYFEARGYNCITPTLRYHHVSPDKSPDPRLGGTSLLDYAADLEKEILQLDKPPIIIGHSMGALLAQILGSRGRARALVLLTPAPPNGIFFLSPSIIKSFWSILTMKGFYKNPVRQTFKEASFSTLNLLPEKEQRNLFDRFVHESGKAVFEIGFWFLDQKGASRVDHNLVTVPVLIIGAGKDRITPVSLIDKVAERYEKVSTYRVFPGNAHWVVGEPGWKQIAEFINDWLKETINHQE